MILFVYGTLKRGFGLNGYLQTSRFVGEAVTYASAYKMVTVGFPIVTLGGEHRVAGEVYEVTDPVVISALDRVEGGYDRIAVAVEMGGRVSEAFIYIGKPGRGRFGHPVSPNADGVLVFTREHGGW